MEDRQAEDDRTAGLDRAASASYPLAEESVLQRLPWLLFLTSIVLVVLVYPLRLEQQWLDDLLIGWRVRAPESWWARLCLDQFESFFSFFHSPLIFKGALAAICCLASLASWLALKVVASLSNGSRAPSDRAAGGTGAKTRGGVWTHRLWLAFILWAALSALWSPTPALSRDAAPWLAVFGLMGYLLLRRGIALDEARQLAVLLMGLGAVVGAICILQATGLFGGFIFKFFLKWNDPRNAYGSLIGHNSAAASFMLITVFPALAFAVDGRTNLRRAMAIAYLTLALLTIVVAQGRSVWILAPILTAAFALQVARRRKLLWPRRAVGYSLAALVAAVASQTIRTDWNPLYLKDNPIGRRFDDLRPSQLIKETRLRTLACSLPLARERPLIGWGLYSFPFIYPKAQADYFALHEDSRLGRTERRTRMAHNEYLQTLVEQGLIGLGLLAAALGAIFLRGRRLSEDWRGSGRLIHTAFGFSALAIALDAVVNFPFHVPQLLVPWLGCVAVYGALRAEPPPEAGAAAASDSGGPAGSAPTQVAQGSPPPPTTIRAGHVGRLVASWLIVMTIPLASYPFAAGIQADIEFLFASSRIELIHLRAGELPPAAERAAISESVVRLKRAIAIQPSHDQARFMLGDAYYLQGLYLVRNEPSISGVTAAPNVAATQAFQTAIASIDESMRSYRHHRTFHLAALCFGTLKDVAPLDRRDRMREAYRRSLETAVYYSAAFVPAVYLLAEWLAAQPEPDIGRIVALRRSIRRYNPSYFYERYRMRVEDRLKLRDYDNGALAAEGLVQTDPSDIDYLDTAIFAHMMAAKPENLRRALVLIERFRRLEVDRDRYPLHPYFVSLAGLYEALIFEQWATALIQLSYHGRNNPEMQALLIHVERHARDQLGRHGYPTRFPRPEDFSAEQWALLVAEKKPVALYRLLRDLEGAREAFEDRPAMEGPPPQIDFWIEYGSLALHVEDWDLLEECASEIRARDPNHPQLDYWAEQRPV